MNTANQDIAENSINNDTLLEVESNAFAEYHHSVEATKSFLTEALSVIEKIRNDEKFKKRVPINIDNIEVQLKEAMDMIDVVHGSGASEVSVSIPSELRNSSEYIIETFNNPGGTYESFYKSEAPYLISTGVTNQQTLDHINPVLDQVFVSMAAEGHSGGSYGFHRSVFVRTFELAIAEVQKRKLPFSESAAVTWKELEQFELQATGCQENPDSYAFNYAFDAKSHLELTHADLELIKHIVSNCLDLNPLTKLTLEKSEWNDVSEYSPGEKLFQNNRCSAVFKVVTEDDAEYIYNLNDGLRFNDGDPEGHCWFTRGGLEFSMSFDPEKPLGSQRYAIFIKWPDGQEAGTTPDGNWDEYVYLPELPDVPAVGTHLRKFNFETLVVKDVELDDNGKLVNVIVENVSRADIRLNISAEQYKGSFEVKGYKCPNYSIFDPEYWSRKRNDVDFSGE